jgi:hypothetical protein
MLVDLSCVCSLRCLHMSSARMSVIVLVTASGCRFLLGDGPDNDSADAATGSGSIDAYVMPDANTDPKCAFGGAGLPQGGICLSELPTTSPAIPTTIDTDTSGLCVAYSKGGGTYCVIAGMDLAVANVRVTGSKPLVMIATNALSITGTLDVASHTATASRGAGTDPATCDYGIPPNSGNNPETRGGAGGSFGGSGGRGGLRNGQQPATDSGVPGARATINPPALLRGGCRGQSGFGAGGAVGGFGGGAVYLIAGVVINLTSTGAVNASGAGGNGGATAATFGRGGAGGGAGGMIVLEAPTVNVVGKVFADGGGGGEGGGGNNPGNYGYESDGTARAQGGNGNAGNGGDGGAGSYGTMLDGVDGNNNGVDSGGGGGGGAGVIWIHGPAGSQTGVISPPPRAI